GTHIDAPMHFVVKGAPIDQVALDPLIGAARVIDIPDSVRAIDSGELNRHDWRSAKRVLFRTRSTLRGWMDSPEFHWDFAYIAPGLKANVQCRRVESSKPKKRSIRQLPSGCRSRKATYLPNSVMRSPLEARQDCWKAPNSVAWSGATRRVETVRRRSMSFSDA